MIVKLGSDKASKWNSLGVSHLKFSMEWRTAVIFDGVDDIVRSSGKVEAPLHGSAVMVLDKAQLPKYE